MQSSNECLMKYYITGRYKMKSCPLYPLNALSFDVEGQIKCDLCWRTTEM